MPYTRQEHVGQNERVVGEKSSRGYIKITAMVSNFFSFANPLGSDFMTFPICTKTYPIF